MNLGIMAGENLMNFKRVIGTIIFTVILCALPRASHAGSLGSDILSMFPKDSGELAYADLKEARAFSWFTQLKEQMLPPKFREFESFLASAGVDPNTQVTELAWALVSSKAATDSKSAGVPSGEHIVGVALGQFQPATAEAYFISKKVPVVKVRTFSLFSFGGGSGP